MATNEVPRGPISGYVVENVKRLRGERRWSLAELSDRMGQVGRPILSSGLHRLEQGRRRVDVDDLVGLALALEVSPVSLLLPPVGAGPIEIADEVVAEAKAAWDWIRARQPLVTPADDDGFADIEFQKRALPLGIRSYPMRTEAQRDITMKELSKLGWDSAGKRWVEAGGDDDGQHPEAP